MLSLLRATLLLGLASALAGDVASSQMATRSQSAATSGPEPALDQVKLATTTNPVEDDMWSIVASMRDNNNGKSVFQSHQIKSPKFDWNINLDQSGRYKLNWHVNYHANKISFGLQIDTNKSNFRLGSDMFALGFSERGELPSSDFCLIWFDLGHRLNLQDAHTDSSSTLKLVDSSESVCRLIKKHHRSVHLISSRNHADDGEQDEAGAEFEAEHLNELDRREPRGGGHGDKPQVDAEQVLEIMFRRPLEVCDKRGRYYAIDNGTTHLVWFTLKGPVLSLDRLNLNEFHNQVERASEPHRDHHEDNKGPASQSDPRRERAAADSLAELSFEWGLRRVQLIATKPAATATATAYSKEGELEHASRELEIRMDKYEVRPKETTYWCKLFKLPQRFESRRFHITSYEAVIESGNEHVVHHMELFNCANLSPQQRRNLDQLYESQGGWSGECAAPTRPQATESCRRVILAWAMGAKPLIYPKQVGQSIGGPSYSPYVVLEVHYNNVARTGGLVDSSGLRFHYSSRLRPFDAGVLEVGLEYTDKNSVPPRMVTPLVGYCVSECTRTAMSHAGQSDEGPEQEAETEREAAAAAAAAEEEEEEEEEAEAELSGLNDSHKDNGQDDLKPAAPNHHGHKSRANHRRHARRHRPTTKRGQHNNKPLEEGIYIFAGQMHTHLSGVASWTEHVRGGRLLGELQRDDHYSPHFQEIRLLPEPVHLAPGDALVHYCLYDTRSRPNVTLGGFATTEEMCVTYLHYYPKIDLEVCKSSVETRALEEYFGWLRRDEGQGTSASADSSAEHASEQQEAREYANAKSVGENYHSIDWSARRSRELVEFYARAPLSVQCNRSDGSRWPGSWEGIEPTRLANWPPKRREQKASSRDQRDKRDEPPDFFKRPSGRELVAYRGLGYRARHAQCLRRSAQSEAELEGAD